MTTRAINNTNVSLDTQSALPDMLKGMVDSSLLNLQMPAKDSGPKTASLTDVATSGEQAQRAVREISNAGRIFELR